MKKILILALVFVGATVANAQILYRISGNGLKKASYIVGTHHLVDESFVNQILGINIAMKETKQVYGEVRMADMLNPDTVKALQQAMMLPDGQTIRDVIDPDHYEMLNILFEQIIGVRFDNDMIFKSMGSMRPSAIENQIQVLLYLNENPGAFDPNKGIDTYFQNQAVKAKKTVGGLETCQFQMDILFNSQPIEEEVAGFNCLLDNIDLNRKQLTVLTEAYRNQDAKGIDEAMNMKYDNECDKFTEISLENILMKRNKNWLAKMPDIMKKNPTLFVVGVGHLLGEEGIISMLTNAGFTVTPVSK